MGYRRKSEDYLNQRRWEGFIRANKALVDATGLPLLILESDELWTDFLMHGYLDHHQDPMRFSVSGLGEEQHQALRELVAAYFEAGYPYFEPTGLKNAADISKLRERFGR